ncbi:MAG: 50S ribosomal protein L18 [Chloroflexi bacterium]|nr:50S ribosomal protein L18 [Chloroflexota bacterium]
MATATRRKARLRRHVRVRKKMSGTAERPRLSVFRSLNHIYAQVIDDNQGHTLTCASSLDSPVKEETQGKSKREVAKLVGALIASRAGEKGVRSVVLDRGGYRYFGRVQALAEGAREGGLIF